MLQSAELRFLLFSLLVQALRFACISASYQSVFSIFDIHESLLDFFYLSTASNFMTTILPSGGLSGLAVFLTNARRKGYPAGKITIATILFIAIEYISLLIIVFLSLIVLFRRQNLEWGNIVAAILLSIISLSLIAVMVLGLKSPVLLGKILAWGARQINKVTRIVSKKQTLISQENTYGFANDICSGMSILKTNIQSLWLPILLSLSNRLLMISMLALTFFSFRVPTSPGTVIAGYGIANMLANFTPSPSGIGVIEGLLTLSLSSLNVKLEAATIISLAYRGISFWIPFFVGLITFQLFFRNDKSSNDISQNLPQS